MKKSFGKLKPTALNGLPVTTMPIMSKLVKSGRPNKRERNPNEPEPDLQSIIAVLQRGEKPRYGDEEEKRQRQEILDRLEQLERMLPEKSRRRDRTQ